MVHEHLFFGTNPIRVHKNEHEDGCRRYEPVDRESAASPHEDRPEVSGVSDKPVWAAINDRLRLSRAQRARVVTPEDAHRPYAQTETKRADSHTDPRDRRAPANDAHSRGIEQEGSDERSNVCGDDEPGARPICIAAPPTTRRLIAVPQQDF